MDRIPFCETNRFLRWSWNSSHFIESKGSSPHSQVRYVSVSQFNMLLIVNYFFLLQLIGQEVRPNINLCTFGTNSNVKLLTYSLHVLRLPAVFSLLLWRFRRPFLTLCKYYNPEIWHWRWIYSVCGFKSILKGLTNVQAQCEIIKLESINLTESRAFLKRQSTVT